MTISIARETIRHWWSHKPGRLGAALSYYAIFSIAPILLILVAVLSMFAERPAAEEAIYRQVQNTIGEQGVELARNLLEPSGESSEKRTDVIATIVGIIILLATGTAVLSELKQSLDEVWETPKNLISGFKFVIKKRLLGISLIPVLIILLLASLLATSAYVSISQWMPLLHDNRLIAEILNNLLTYVVSLALFAFIYRFLTVRKLPHTEVWLGALLTALLFVIGKIIISVYLSKFLHASTYGAAASLVVVMAWVYYSAQIFLIGASFTYVYSKMNGSLKETSQPTVERSAETI